MGCTRGHLQARDPVFFRDAAGVAGVADSCKLVGEQTAQHVTVQFRFGHTDIGLDEVSTVDLVAFMPAHDLATDTGIRLDIVNLLYAPEQTFQRFHRLFRRNTIDFDPCRYPLEQPDRTAFEHEPHLLPVHTGGLMEPVVEIYQHVAVRRRTVDLLDNLCTLPDSFLGRYNPARPEPPCEQIEKMDAVFDKYTAAFVPLPEPKARRQPFVLFLVLEKPLQRFAQQWFLDEMKKS